MSSEPKQPNWDPHVVVLYCQHGICDKAKASDWSQATEGLHIRAIMMPCSSKIEVSYILRILESGARHLRSLFCGSKLARLGQLFLLLWRMDAPTCWRSWREMGAEPLILYCNKLRHPDDSECLFKILGLDKDDESGYTYSGYNYNA